ncbi:MAG: hypothetical protein R3240_00185, partial [Gammaproteobacteria bacterium]|nr:hypothetical protein [Gammaproteobacteria bacterium]
MLRLTELRLPLQHKEADLPKAILNKLEIPKDDLLSYHVVRRGYDARKRKQIFFVYSLDIELEHEEKVLKKFAKDSHINPAPDTQYKYVAKAPDNLTSRPVIIGMGPCGFMAGLLLAQMGFKPIILERGKAVRER